MFSLRFFRNRDKMYFCVKKNVNPKSFDHLPLQSFTVLNSSPTLVLPIQVTNLQPNEIFQQVCFSFSALEYVGHANVYL